jgi:Tannase and feruloyl esterase
VHNIPPNLLQLADNAVAANCDASDGAQDGLIQNPGKCTFSPQSLLCQAGNTGNCLSAAQVDTLTRWFSAAKDQEGRLVNLGYPVGATYDNNASGNSREWPRNRLCAARRKCLRRKPRERRENSTRWKSTSYVYLKRGSSRAAENKTRTFS